MTLKSENRAVSFWSRDKQYRRHATTSTLRSFIEPQYSLYKENTTMAASQRVCHFKLVLLGDTAVGKSCLVVRFVRDEFFDFQEPTIGGKFS